MSDKTVITPSGKHLDLDLISGLKCLGGLEIRSGFDEFSKAVTEENLGKGDILYLIEEKRLTLEERKNGELAFECVEYEVQGPFGNECMLKPIKLGEGLYCPRKLLNCKTTWLM